MNLKPCPFCGERAVPFINERIGRFWIECSACQCGTALKDTPEEAAAAWNRRADDGN